MIVLQLILFTLLVSWSHCKYPDKVYCVNERCDGPISKAKTLITYTSPDPDLISYRSNSDALVYMKSAGTNSELWYAQIGGKSGFVNSKFLREYKIIERSPQFIIPYIPKVNENVQPDKVQQAHEVFEGTTIYTTETANTAQEASTLQPPLTANEDLTPPLKEPIENFDNSSQNHDSTKLNNNVLEENVKDIDNTSPNTINNDSSETNDNIQNTVQNYEPLSEKEFDSGTASSETQNLVEATAVNEEIKVIDGDAVPANGEPEEELINKEQVEQELLNELSTEPPSAEQVPSLTSDTINSESKLPEFDTLNNHGQNIQINQDSTSNINNVPNDHNNLPNELTAEQTSEMPPIHEINDIVSNIDDVENNINEQPYIKPISTSATETLPSVEVPTVAESPSTPVVEVPPASEPSISPVLETVATVLPPPITTETIPAFYPQETQTLTPKTNPVIINMEQPTPEIQYSDSQEFLSSNTETTTSAPLYNNEQIIDQQNIPESIIQDPESSYYSSEDNTYTISNEQQVDEISSTTESPTQDEYTEGFFSNMYSTVADIWPSTTEEPPPIYNTGDYPTYEKEKAVEDEGFSFMKYIISTYYTIMGTSEETKALFASVGETCYKDEYCDGTSNDGTNRLLTFLLTTATSVLLFTLGYYYIDNRRQDGRLIGQINSLQRDLLFTTKECEILKEQLLSTKNKLAGIEDSSFGMDDMVQSLKEEINELKATNERLRNSLDDNEKLLRVSENTAGELQNTLSEVENTLSELLAERANSEEQIVELNGKIQAFEEELISVSRDRDNFQLKYVSAESASEELKKQKKQLEDATQQLSESRNLTELQKHEINALKEVLKELKNGIPSNIDVTALIDHTEIKAKLSKALEEKKTFESKYETEHKEKVRLAEELQNTQETLHTTSQNATEALTRLDVLGKYFQERESELIKELNTKEALWLSKQGESTSTVEKMELLQQEIQRYKEKCDALTLELAEQESSRRAALSEVEARAHAAWLEARGARRDADAARDEAAALRRKLASLSTIAPADGAVSPHHKVASPLENVENTVIPPPLPPMFLPPPLLPPLPRPPPLGRLPSPHPPRYGDRRYSPDSRYSPESRYSPDSRYSPETVRYSPDSRYSPRSRRLAYSPRSRRRSRERYEEGRGSRPRNGPADTETEYNSDSPSREPRRRRYSRHSGPSSGSGCSSESDK